MAILLTAKTGRNKDLFKDIANHYILDSQKVCDFTYGHGNFWKEVDTSRFNLTRLDIVENVDVKCDSRNCPFPNSIFDVVVLDPPYVYNPKGTFKKSISDSYNINENQIQIKDISDVYESYNRLINEAIRVTKKKGFIIVKRQDQIRAGKQYWMHIDLVNKHNLYLKDLFVLVQSTQPAIRWPRQIHARKNHSYFLVFQNIDV